MPFSIPAADVVLTDANFTSPLKSFVDGLETSTAAAQSSASAANTLAGQKYTKPAGGIPTTDLVGTVVTSSVSGVKVEPITQAAYDALVTKAANTLYVIPA